jgi:hypothetical protein
MLQAPVSRIFALLASCPSDDLMRYWRWRLALSTDEWGDNMKALMVAAAGVALFGTAVVVLPGSASAGIFEGCKVPAALFNSNGRGGQVSFGSANTNSGNGNGGEIASIGGCVSGIESPPDSSVNIDAFTGAPFFNTDPGKSSNEKPDINIP